MRLFPCIAILLLCSSLATATPPAGTLERVTKQQILASIPPDGAEPVLFLTSPSGKYVAYFVRTHTVPGAGGLGADFCYVQVVDTTATHGGHVGIEGGGGTSVWESECRPISTVNTCALLFSWDGLEVFDGSEEVWHGETNRDGTNFLETLELVDDGDMRIRDKDGELAWRASDEPRHAQRCGAPGSPGLATALPPFAEPIGTHSSDLPFGLVPAGNGHAAVLPAGGDLPEAADVGDGAEAALGGATAPAGLGQGDDDAAAFGGATATSSAGLGQGEHDAAASGGVTGFGNQPLVDNSPFDSGAWMEGRGARLAAIGVALCVSALLGFMGVGL